jgi:hypothetical protein
LPAAGIERGVIALSKSDLADADMLEIAALEVRDLVAGSFLADAPMLPVSARTGAGLDALVSALAALAGARPRQARDGVVRLPVDRVQRQGFGAVVTGTLVSGELRATPSRSAAGGRTRSGSACRCTTSRSTRVRAERVAVNLGGSTRTISRGVTLATPEHLHGDATPRRAPRAHSLGPFAQTRRARASASGHDRDPGRISVAATRRREGDDWRAARPGDPSVLIDPGGSAVTCAFASSGRGAHAWTG